MAQKDSGTATQPGDMKLSIMKPTGAKWMIEGFDYIQSHPDMIRNGFNNVGTGIPNMNFLKISCL